MEIKQVHMVPLGMNQDLSISKFNQELSYENWNIRIIPNESDSALSIANEQGNELISNVALQGQCLGYAVLNQYLVLFTKSSTLDYIYRIENINNPTTVVLFSGNLNFSLEYPIESLPLYETETVQKIYFTDNRNPLRVINIVADPSQWVGNDAAFNFVPLMRMTETVSITQKRLGGLFNSGVIQYAVSYFNAFGAETGAFFVSDLHYLSLTDRAPSPEQISSNSFDIALSNLDMRFEYIRIYAIQRSSLNAVPNVRIVGDYPYKPTMVVTDTGQFGYAIDPQILLYLGAEELIAKTIGIKDNTFFGANLTLNKGYQLSKFLPSLKTYFQWAHRADKVQIEALGEAFSGLYTYTLKSLTQPRQAVTHFKRGQYYRFGIQGQLATGQWTDPFWIGEDKLCNIPYLTEVDTDTNEVNAYLNQGNLSLPAFITNLLLDNGYKQIRPIFVYPDAADRVVIAQGVLGNTLAFNHLRANNSPFSFADYAFRPNWFGKLPLVHNHPDQALNLFGVLNTGHLLCTVGEASVSASSPLSTPYVTEKRTLDTSTPESAPYELFMDEHLVSLYSPDVQYSGNLNSLLTSDLYCQFVGVAHLRSSFYGYNRIIVGTADDKVSYTSRANFDSLDDITISGSTGAEQYRAPFNLTLKQAQNNEVKLLQSQSKLYALYNTIFRDDAEVDTFLKYPINKPEHCDANDLSPLFPYITNSVDNGGVITYAKDFEENLIVTLPGSPTIPTVSRFAYKSNSHLIFSYKDSSTDLLSKVTPNFNLEEGLFNDWIGGEEGKPSSFVLVSTLIGWEPLQSNIVGTEYRVTYSIPIHIMNLDNFAAEDIITIQPKVFVKTYLIGDELFSIINAGPQIDLTKAAYLALDSYGFGDYKKLPLIDVPIGTAPTVGENDELVYQVGDIIMYLREAPIITAVPAEKFIINGVAPVEEQSNAEGVSTANGNQQLYTTIPYYRKPSTYGYMKQLLDATALKYDHPKNGALEGMMYMPIVELRRNISPSSLYGGTTTEALLNNMWLPCGAPAKLVRNQASILAYRSGDTYLRRYDCLKTVPTNEEEVCVYQTSLSFLCETYVNLDGRYDRNRYTLDLTPMRFTNYGLLNPVYSQSNNFFNYRIVDPRIFNTNKFPNQLVWSPNKTPGSLVDSWTRLNLASIAELPGNMGPINSLQNFNGELLAFQDKGIANILFNSRVQIPASDGVPIEIANSNKFDSYRYITNQSGCTNKQSIIISRRGLYYIDSLNKSFNRLSEGISNLSDEKGFKVWSSKNLTANGKLYVNKLLSDIYILDSGKCLCFSELSDNFTSFYNYQNANFIFNFDKEGLAISGTNTTTLYIQNKGLYNHFFGSFYPSSIQYKVNPDPILDKVFTNLDYRADCFDASAGGTLLPNRTFDSIRVWNEYQDTSETPLILYKNLFKKFRVWRSALPRQENSLNRIRNTWVNMKLTFLPKAGENIRLNLHDMAVVYTIP